MLCQNCHKRTANVHFTHIVNNQMVEMYLCEQCAKQKNTINISIPLDLNNFLTSFMNIPQEVQQGAQPGTQQSAGQDSPACSKCGMTYQDFRNTGKMGCSNCYTTFGNRLMPLLKRIHRGVAHSGKVPGKIGEDIKAAKEIQKLKDELKAAVQKEEYERAAELRDRIKEAESRIAQAQKG